MSTDVEKAPSKLDRALQRFGRFLFQDEEATAAAELVILVPLYITILYGLIFFGQGMLIRQQATEAARFMAFKAPTSTVGDVKGFFDDRFDGLVVDAQRVPPQAARFKPEDIRNALETEPEGRHAEVIARLLDNGDSPLVEKHGAALVFRYQAAWAAFAGVLDDTLVRAELSLYHLKSDTRPVFSEGKDHPIMAYRDVHPFEAERYEAKLPEDLRDPRGKGPWDIGWRPEKGAAGEAYYQKYIGISDTTGVHPLGP